MASQVWSNYFNLSSPAQASLLFDRLATDGQHETCGAHGGVNVKNLPQPPLRCAVSCIPRRELSHILGGAAA